MEALLAEVTKKRKDLTDPIHNAHGNKYMRKADLEKARAEEAKRVKDEQAQKKREEALMKEREKQDRLSKLRAHTSSSRSPASSPAPSSSKPEAFNISSAECIRRLRTRSQPILLFGETEKERRLRLRALEVLEERGGGAAAGAGGGGLNDFKKAMEEAEVAGKLREAERQVQAKVVGGKSGTPVPAGTSKGEDGADSPVLNKEGEAERLLAVAKKESDEGKPLDLNLVKTEPRKVYPLIYWAIKGWLAEWNDYMDARPEEIKRTSAGRNAAAIVIQTHGYLKPLMKSLKARDLEPDVLKYLAEIVHNVQIRQYQRANDAYLRLSIGTAAWPIGVTMVGIHERSAREKIGVDSVAHVLNDEVSRKYIQSVKRLMTFAQTIRPPADVSQLMG